MVTSLHRSTATLLFAVLAGATAVAVPAQAARQAGREGELTVAAPATVEVGRAIDLWLRVRVPGALAGVEAFVRFDETAAELGGVFAGGEDASWAGVESIVADEAPGGVAFLLHGCDLPGCRRGHDQREFRRQLGDIHVRLVPVRPGPLAIGLDGVSVVDRAGRVLDVAVPGDDVVVDVIGESEEGPPLVPDEPDELASTASADASTTSLDSVGELATLTTAWADHHAAGAVCDSNVPDLNGDGCLDVSDVQLAATAAADSADAGADPPLDTAVADPMPSGMRRAPLQYPMVGQLVRQAASSTVFTVNTLDDLPDANIGNGACLTSAGTCSLRAAIHESNAVAGPNTIQFAIAGSGVRTIQLAAALPTINDDSGGLTIDGFTQAGASPNTDPLASNATILVEVRGNGTAHHGFTIVSPGNVIRGLAVFAMVDHIRLNTSNASGNRIVGNLIGTNAAATFRSTASWDAGHGVHVENGAHDNLIGTPALADRNVISGAAYVGVRIDHERSDSNLIQNNIFGLNPAGTAKVPNGRMAVDVQWGPSFNLIGGLGQRELNVMSGHSYTGVDLSHSKSTSHNEVVGNRIGTTLDGEVVRSYTRTWHGIVFKDDVADNLVHHNVVGGAQTHALWHKHVYTGRNTIRDNRIGISASGAALPNAVWGMYLQGHDWIVGPGNLFANNASGGILVVNAASDRNRLTQNLFIGNGGLAIDLAPVGATANDSGDADTGPNEGLNHPIVQSVSTVEARGTACAGCSVEVYHASVDTGSRGEGFELIANGVADQQGAFRIATAGADVGASAAAIAIDGSGNTSEFSPVMIIADGDGDPPPPPPPPPNLLANGDFELDANGDGRPDSWTWKTEFTTTTEQVFSGERAGRHASTANASYIIKTPVEGLAAGTTYRLTGAVSIPSTSDSFEIALQVQWRNDAGLVGTVTAARWTTPTAGYVPFSVDVSAPAGTQRAQVMMNVKSLNATIYVDGFSFSVVP